MKPVVVIDNNSGLDQKDVDGLARDGWRVLVVRPGTRVLFAPPLANGHVTKKRGK